VLKNINHIFILITFNLFIFIFLVIGIQNSADRKKVNFIFKETIELPLSFILGSSFIVGSITGGLIGLGTFKIKK
tara:strand:+ start:229 stop:453 length:225 start_codon:yes stop_codon:yes gene_type:complete